METVNAGHMMSLAALQRQDPYINRLLDVTGQVALYNFNSKASEWEKTDIEGTLFVYARSASPRHGFTIMNRLSAENLVEPINKDLEFQLQDPFLLYKNGSLGIYSIWFYDKRDCQRIAQLMVKIVKQEAELAQRGSPDRPERTGGSRANGLSQPAPIDILELLSKAKEEYQRTQTGDPDVSAVPNAKAPVNAREHAHSTPQAEKTSHTMVKQITVEELFGSSLHKVSSLPIMPSQHTTTSTATASNNPPGPFLHNQPPYPQKPPVPPHVAAAQDSSHWHHQTPGLIPAPYALHPSPVFQSVVPRSDPQPRCSVSPLMMGPEILGTLKPAGGSSSVNSDVHKPVLAPSFLTSTLYPPHSFQEPMGKVLGQPGNKDMEVFSQLPNMIKPASVVTMSPSLAGPGSVLLSPSAFLQSINKTPAAAAAAVVVPPSPAEPSSSISTGASEPQQAPCSKTQLQDTLIHLIKNDPDFLSAIHDAYLQSRTKDFSNMKL